jgi:DNA-directed RNA polymerase specialized sigma24 family protein
MDGGTTGFAKRLRPLRRLNDDDLAAAAASGDERAVAVIFERFQEPLYRYCAAILRNPEQATEALQMTTLAATAGLQEGERSIALRPWLYALARQESLELLAARSPRHSTGGNGLGARLAALPEPKRSALLMRELGGLEYAEIAAALDLGSNAARQAALNARRLLEPAGPDRTAGCAAIRIEMSVNEGRFRRRRDIREHRESCPDCSGFAASLAERPRELQTLFALPAGVAAAVVAGETAMAAEEPDRARHGRLVAFLLLAVALGSVAALAALGTFDSGRGNRGRHGGGNASATPVQVAPGQRAPGTGPGGTRARRHGGRAGRQGSAAQRQGTQAQAQGSPAAPQGSAPGAIPSAVSAYTTPGERTEGLLGAP